MGYSRRYGNGWLSSHLDYVSMTLFALMLTIHYLLTKMMMFSWPYWFMLVILFLLAMILQCETCLKPI